MTLARLTGTPLRNAASGLLPLAYSQSPILERWMGSQTIATTIASSTSALGSQSVPSDPRTRSFSQSGAPPPGVGSTSSAAPAQTKPIASVTTMSGILVRTISVPLIAPSIRPSTSTAINYEYRVLRWLILHACRGNNACQCHHGTDREVDSAGDHDHRLGRRGEGEGQGLDGQVLDAGWTVRGLDEAREREQHAQGRRAGRSSSRSCARR